MFDFRIFFSVMLVHMSVLYMLTISAILDYQFDFDTYKKVSRVLVCSSIFYYSKKWIKDSVLSFVLINEIKCARTFEMLTAAVGESTISRT